MKILIYGINFSPELTGIGKYTGEMSQWLSKNGHDVSVVTAFPYYPAWKSTQGYSLWRYKSEWIGGVRVLRCPLWVPSHPSGISRILHLLSFALSSLPVMLLYAIRRPNVVLTIEPPLFCAPTAWLTGVLSGAKTWLHVQDLEVDAAFKLGLIKSHVLRRLIAVVESWLMRRFDRISTISKRMMERLVQKGVTEDCQIYFPNWVDTQEIRILERPSLLRQELGLTENQVIALYSGNMGEKQGLEIVIEAARICQNQHHIVFVMCGQGAVYKQLRLRAENLSNVLWLPLQPFARLNELLNFADIHLLPQRADVTDLVMPSKLTGILASGRPVIATMYPGTEVGNVVEKCGVVVKPGDTQAFANSIKELMADSVRRAALGASARDYAVAHFDKNKVLVQFEHDLNCLGVS